MARLDPLAIIVLSFLALSAYFVVSKLLFVYSQYKREQDLVTGRFPELLSPEIREVPLKKLIAGLDDLKAFVSTYDPGLIVGIHPGGRLLSVYVADKISFPRDRCIFAHTEPIRTNEIRLRGWEDRASAGKILVIDDITRTGITLRSVNSHLIVAEQTGRLRFEALHYAVMLAVQQKNRVFEPHWCRFLTRNVSISFPWSPVTEQIKNALNHKVKGLKYQRDFLEVHELIATNFESALRLANLAIERRDRLNRMLKEGKLLSHLLEDRPVLTLDRTPESVDTGTASR
jgi:hypoxanthine phosphoribosyltransferase